jgi:predicted RNase H-like HicB family nuclease
MTARRRAVIRKKVAAKGQRHKKAPRGIGAMDLALAKSRRLRAAIRWEAGKLGSWEAGKLGSWEALPGEMFAAASLGLPFHEQPVCRRPACDWQVVFLEKCGGHFNPMRQRGGLDVDAEETTLTYMPSIEIIFEVREDEVDGGFVAQALGHSIFTQAETVESLREMVKDAVRCHFGDTEEAR